jgi:AraC family transcriptional regulator
MKEPPRIVELEPMQLVGMSLEMSRIDNKTGELWGSFMPRRAEVARRASEDYVSMQVYPAGPGQIADPAARFTKWALVQVEDFEQVPAGMSTYSLGGGTYAVFDHNGPATDLSTVTFIFTQWLPNSSEYELDDREHFEILPPGYDALDPDAHEEFWIPVRARQN